MTHRYIFMVAACWFAANAAVSNAGDDATSLDTNANAQMVSPSRLISGRYFIAQSWSQERDYRRPYYVSVPSETENKLLPVLIFLHGNGGNAQEATR